VFSLTSAHHEPGPLPKWRNDGVRFWPTLSKCISLYKGLSCPLLRLISMSALCSASTPVATRLKICVMVQVALPLPLFISGQRTTPFGKARPWPRMSGLQWVWCFVDCSQACRICLLQFDVFGSSSVGNSSIYWSLLGGDE
jgi:hypothetical protein